jgi:cation diffusion facilitator CzcD-associated flavoprotein CzcO
VTPREPVDEDPEVAIIGADIAGVVAGAQLRKRGIDSVRLIDQDGGIGGTWYWNRYPGVMCDVESYCYMPMLEEMDYIPTKRYAQGEEIRGHVEVIARRFDLVDARCSTPASSAASGTTIARAGCSTPIAATRSARST